MSEVFHGCLRFSTDVRSFPQTIKCKSISSEVTLLDPRMSVDFPRTSVGFPCTTDIRGVSSVVRGVSSVVRGVSSDIHGISQMEEVFPWTSEVNCKVNAYCCF